MQNSQELPKEQIQKMFYTLSQAIASIDNVTDASALLQDLLSFSEAEMIAKRLVIAQELIKGTKYS